MAYPLVDRERLVEESTFLPPLSKEEKGIVFVGDSIVKGLPLVLELAGQMPNTPFYIFSRRVREPYEEGNIRWMPWQEKGGRVYRYARKVIVPSVWEEAYGRVAREAYVLGIPVYVSNVGGLPEAVGEESGFIVDDYKNPEAWKNKLESQQ